MQMHNFIICITSRSRSDWEDAWHQEKYTRCRDTLIRHLYWACEKDIYRITRRSGQEDANEVEECITSLILITNVNLNDVKFCFSSMESSETCQTISEISSIWFIDYKGMLQYLWLHLGRICRILSNE